MVIGKPSRDDVSVNSWQERDRLGIWITDNRTGSTIAEWWDDDARQMFEDGFFKPATFTASGELGGPAFIDSVLDYAEEMGMLAKPGASAKAEVSDIRRHYSHPFLVNWQYGGYSYIEETPGKPERLWTHGMADYVDPEEVLSIAEREGLPSISLAGGFWEEIGYKGYGEKVSLGEAKRVLAKAKAHMAGELHLTSSSGIYWWVRLGDVAEYEKFDTFNEAREYVEGRTNRSFSEAHWINKYGFTLGSYQGLNYISFFEGDQEAQPTEQHLYGKP